MRESSVVKALLEKERIEIARKERTQDIISALEVRFGETDDNIKNCLASIQDEETLKYLFRQSVVAEKDDIERKIRALGECDGLMAFFSCTANSLVNPTSKHKKTNQDT